MTTIKKVNSFSLAKVQGLVGLLVGLIAGVLVFLFGLVVNSSAANTVQQTGGLLAMGGFSIIILPLLYGLFGFIGGFIAGWLYNLVAGWVGGIELELVEGVETPRSQTSAPNMADQSAE